MEPGVGDDDPQLTDGAAAVGEEPLPGRAVALVRKAKKKKKRISSREYDVQVIPAQKVLPAKEEEPKNKRVAAYCRVSTDEAEQESSYELQVEHYTNYISSHDGWELAGIYADKGISGTQVKHREEFKRMIRDCKKGLIDMVLTKSISRFARNQVDCITTIRDLKALKSPVEIYFEKERLSSLDEKVDMMLGIMASFAQEESRSISANIRWAIRNRMRNGTQKVVTAALLGYDTDDDGNMVIIQSEAEIVRIIYKSFIQGVHPRLIAIRLNAINLTTVLGNPWSSDSVQRILRNEKYCGDVLMQKTITIDYLTHASKVNEGEADQYFIQDHHDPIVSRETWNRAQELLDKQNWRRWKKREQQRLLPVRTGFLKGFVAINAGWKSVSLTRLMSAGQRYGWNESITEERDSGEGAMDKREEEQMSEKGILKDFEVVELERSKGDSVMTLTSSSIRFNKATAQELGFPSYVRALVQAPTRLFAITPCSENTKNAVPFSKNEKMQNYAIFLKVPALISAARKLADVEESKEALSFEGTFYPEEKAIIFDLSKGQAPKKRGKRQTEEEGEPSEEPEEIEAVEAEAESEREEPDKSPATEQAESSSEPEVAAVPRRRGRPKKAEQIETPEQAIIKANPGETVVVLPKKRGRRKKTVEE